jgi:hypothetical protein
MIGQKTNAHRILVAAPLEKRPVVKSKHKATPYFSNEMKMAKLNMSFSSEGCKKKRSKYLRLWLLDGYWIEFIDTLYT